MKRIFQSYQKAIAFILQNIELILLWYLANFFFAFLAISPIQNLINNHLAYSKSFEDIVCCWKYATAMDYLNNYGGEFSAFSSLPLAMIVLYFIFNAFFVGGILGRFKKATVGSSIGFRNGVFEYGLKVWRLAIAFLLFHILLFAILFFTYRNIGGTDFPFNLESDAELIDRLKVLGVIYTLLVSFIFAWHDLAKVFLIEMKGRWSVCKSIYQSLKYYLRNFFSCSLLYFVGLIIIAIIGGIYYFVNQQLGFIHGWGFLFVFAFAQFFVILRIGLKVLHLNAVNEWRMTNGGA